MLSLTGCYVYLSVLHRSSCGYLGLVNGSGSIRRMEKMDEWRRQLGRIVSRLNYATIGKVKDDGTVWFDRDALDKEMHKLIMFWRYWEEPSTAVAVDESPEKTYKPS